MYNALFHYLVSTNFCHGLSVQLNQFCNSSFLSVTDVEIAGLLV